MISCDNCCNVYNIPLLVANILLPNSVDPRKECEK